MPVRIGDVELVAQTHDVLGEVPLWDAHGGCRMLAECHANKQEDFDAWLRQKGWQVESVTPIKHLARTGEIWKVS